jgi:hypothetical protein
MFATGLSASQVAVASEVSAEQRLPVAAGVAAGGVQALASKGPSGRTLVLSDARLARLRERLELARRRPGTARTSGGRWHGFRR